MGLDWNPGNKPKPGFEDEHKELMRRMGDGEFRPEPSAAQRFFRSFFKSKPPSEPTYADLLARFHEISITAFETLNAPRIGYDEVATQWLKTIYAENEIDKPEDEWLDDHKGVYVVHLVPPCDGLSQYTNGEFGGYVELYSFRADWLKDCEDIIGWELLGECFETRTSAETVAFGQELLRVAEEYAKQHGIDLEHLDTEIDLERLDTEDVDSDQLKLDVIVSAGRWCLFWGEKGHHLEAYW